MVVVLVALPANYSVRHVPTAQNTRTPVFFVYATAAVAAALLKMLLLA